MIPFEQIQAASLAQAPRLLAEWFPRGKRAGKRFKVGNISGDAGEFLSINLTDGKWADFAGNDSGRDLIDLRAAMAHAGDRVAAAIELGDMLGITTNGKDREETEHVVKHKANGNADSWAPMVPPPVGTPRPDRSLMRGFDTVFEYTDAHDRVTHYVGRIEARGDRDKVFVPLTFGLLEGVRGWHRKAPDQPLPLYGLNRLLISMPEATVILCEGEKSADAAQALFPDYACLSWMGGFRRADHADLSPLKQRKVIVWPDNDPPGQEAAAKILQQLPGARLLRVNDLPPKADAADLQVDDADVWLEAHLPADPAPALRSLLSMQSWADREIPAPDRLLGDLITTTTRTFIVGPTGLGKTMLGMAIARGLAAGCGFLHWRSARAARVLYVDGEMPGELIKARSLDALRRGGSVPHPDNLLIYSAEMDDHIAAVCPSLGKMQPLNTEAGQRFIMALIDVLGGVDVVVFDNVMSLVVGDQKDEVPWSETMPLIAALTQRRVGQVWLDHTGHTTGRQYGSATKAWRFDTVGIMAPLSDDQRERHDVAFTLSFDTPGKARRRTPGNWQDFETCTIRLREDQWSSDVARQQEAPRKKLSPEAEQFYRALLDATTRSDRPGEATRDGWFDECVRLGLATTVATDDTHAARERKRGPFRKNLSKLKTAGWIGVDGETVRPLTGHQTGAP